MQRPKKFTWPAVALWALAGTLVWPVAGAVAGVDGGARDAGAKDGQAGDLAPWEQVDGMTAATSPGPGGGDGRVVEEGCDCDSEQCTQAPGAAPLAGAAGLALFRRRRKRRRRS